MIMVSALTQEGADVTLQALELGAVDFMPKPERNQLAEMRACADLLVGKVLTAAQSRVRRFRRPRAPADSSASSAGTASPTRPGPARATTSPVEGAGKPPGLTTTAPAASPPGLRCLLIGISTGGPRRSARSCPT